MSDASRLSKPHTAVRTLIGRGTSMEGRLRFQGALRIDGEFEGQIASEGALIISESARVHADIEVGEVIIHGALIGNVYAKRRVELLAPGSLRGNVATPSLVIGTGAKFEGRTSTQAKQVLGDDSNSNRDLILIPEVASKTNPRPN